MTIETLIFFIPVLVLYIKSFIFAKGLWSGILEVKFRRGGEVATQMSAEHPFAGANPARVS